MPDIQLVDKPMPKAALRTVAAEQFGDMVKAVVDLERGIMAIGGELHADEEAFLLERGSRPHALWGINIYPDHDGEGMIEYNSMINVRPSQGNDSRDIADASVRAQLLAVVSRLITP